MKREWMIRKAGRDEHGNENLPWGLSYNSHVEAHRAAEYNSKRWGPHEVVTRMITDWEVVP